MSNLKLDFKDYKKLHKMSHNELSRWIVAFYENAYVDGYNKAEEDMKEKGTLVELDTMIPFYKIDIILQATKGIGAKKRKEIMDNMESILLNDGKGPSKDKEKVVNWE